MKTKLLSLIFLALIGFKSFSQSSSETIVELMNTTGSTAIFDHLDLIINSKILEKKSSFENEENYANFATVISSSFNEENAKKYFNEYFEKNTNEEKVKEIISLYKQPLLVEMTQLEVEASDPSKQQEQIEFFQGLGTNPPSPERVQQLITLDNEVGTSKMTVKLLQNMITTIAKGGNQAQPKEKQIAIEDLEKQITSSLPANFSQDMENQIIASYMYIYKDINDEKLNEYINIWKTPTGKYYTSKLFEGLDYTFSKIGESFGKNLINEK